MYEYGSAYIPTPSYHFVSYFSRFQEQFFLDAYFDILFDGLHQWVSKLLSFHAPFFTSVNVQA